MLDGCYPTSVFTIWHKKLGISGSWLIRIFPNFDNDTNIAYNTNMNHLILFQIVSFNYSLNYSTIFYWKTQIYSFFIHLLFLALSITTLSTCLQSDHKKDFKSEINITYIQYLSNDEVDHPKTDHKVLSFPKVVNWKKYNVQYLSTDEVDHPKTDLKVLSFP